MAMTNQYILNNNKILFISTPETSDAEGLIGLILQADCETPFLARNPGEFSVSVEQETEMIKRMKTDNSMDWFLAKIDGKIIGMCSVSLVRNNLRFRHRAECAFIVLKDYWRNGIGSILMENVISWCKIHGVEQLELDYVEGNHQGDGLYKKYGFEYWGTLKNGIKYPDGSYKDLVHMRLEV